jgi:hypothetical protein
MNFVNIEELKRQTTSVSIKFGDEVIKCEVAFNAITLGFLKELEDDTEAALKIIQRVVKTWDVTENGQVLPVNIENLRKMPISLLQTMTEALTQRFQESQESINKNIL